MKKYTSLILSVLIEAVIGLCIFFMIYAGSSIKLIGNAMLLLCILDLSIILGWLFGIL